LRSRVVPKKNRGCAIARDYYFTSYLSRRELSLFRSLQIGERLIYLFPGLFPSSENDISGDIDYNHENLSGIYRFLYQFPFFSNLIIIL